MLQHQSRPSSEEYKTACWHLVEKFNTLEDKIGSGIVSLLLVIFSWHHERSTLISILVMPYLFTLYIFMLRVPGKNNSDRNIEMDAKVMTALLTNGLE